jgi:hypothetical protein
MSLDPKEFRFGFEHCPCLDALQDRADEIHICLEDAIRFLPAFERPAIRPIGKALDRVQGIGTNEHTAIHGGYLEGRLDCREFGALVGLLARTKRSANIPTLCERAARFFSLCSTAENSSGRLQY